MHLAQLQPTFKTTVASAARRLAGEFTSDPNQARPNAGQVSPDMTGTTRDSFKPQPVQAPEAPVVKEDSGPELAGWKKTLLAVAMATSAITGMAGQVSAAPLVSQVMTDHDSIQPEMPVVIIPEGTPRMDVIRETRTFDTSGGDHVWRQEYAPVGVHLGGGLVHDANGNLSMIPTLAHDWDLTIDDYKQVDVQGRSVARFGNTVHYNKSGSKRFVFTEKHDSVDILSTEGPTKIEKNEQGHIVVKGPDNLEYTVVPLGQNFQILKGGESISVLRAGGEIRVNHGDRTTAGSSLTDEGLEVVTQLGRGRLTRSDSGVITEMDGSRGWGDYKFIRDGDVMLIQKPGRDHRVEVNPQAPLREAEARFQALVNHLEKSDPGYSERHPIIMSVLEYASANPALLIDEDGTAEALMQAGTRVATVGTVVETGVALTQGATALSLAEQAHALGGAALSAKAAAEAAAAAGEMTHAAALAAEAQNLGNQAKQLGAEAMKKGKTATNAAEVARIMMGVGATLEMIDGGFGLHQGKSERSLIEGAVAVTQAKMDQLSEELEGEDLDRAMQDYTKVMRVLEELNQDAGKKMTVGKLKIGFGGVMLVSAILGPEAPAIIGLIGLAGTAGTTIYEHWDPIYEFFTGQESDGTPDFIDIIPDGDQIDISLDNRKKSGGGN